MTATSKKKRISRTSAGSPFPRRERRTRLTPIERRSLLLVVFLFFVGMLVQAIRQSQGRSRQRPTAQHSTQRP